MAGGEFVVSSRTKPGKTGIRAHSLSLKSFELNFSIKIVACQIRVLTLQIYAVFRKEAWKFIVVKYGEHHKRDHSK